MRWTFVTCANANYFPLLQGMILSIVDRAGEAAQPVPDIHILDIGLQPDQRHWLQQYVKGFIRPNWDVGAEDAAFLEAHGGEVFKAMTARPNLPSYLPQYDLVFWMDADAWLQRWEVIAWHLAAAGGGRMAVTPVIHRAFPMTFHTSPSQQALFEIHRYCVDDALAQALVFQLQQINSGVFALETKSPVWQIWADCSKQILAHMRSKDKFTGIFEQVALNVAIYTRRAPVHFLPATCNWLMGESDTTLDAERNLFVEPLIPHEPVGIVHITHTAMGNVQAKLSPINVITRDRQRTFTMSIDYLSVRQSLHGLKLDERSAKTLQ